MKIASDKLMTAAVIREQFRMCITDSDRITKRNCEIEAASDVPQWNTQQPLLVN